jgi:hypothetical protein
MSQVVSSGSDSIYKWKGKGFICKFESKHECDAQETEKSKLGKANLYFKDMPDDKNKRWVNVEKALKEGVKNGARRRLAVSLEKDGKNRVLHLSMPSS